MTQESNIPAATIAWGFGFALATGFIVGLVMGDHAKLVVKRQAIAQFDGVALAVCADFLETTGEGK